MYQFSYEDLFVRPDIYPWLANIYIDEKYRNTGICRKLMESVKENALNNINSNELYLYTKHINLYEKFGWKYISDIDTYNKENKIQRLADNKIRKKLQHTFRGFGIPFTRLYIEKR